MVPIEPNDPIDSSDTIDLNDPIDLNDLIDPNDPIDPNDHIEPSDPIDPIDSNVPRLEAAWGKRLLLPIMQRLSERVTQPGYTRVIFTSPLFK